MNALISHIRIDSAIVCIYFISLQISKQKCDYPYNLRYVMLIFSMLLSLRYLSVIIFTVLKKTHLNNTTLMLNINKILSGVTFMFVTVSILNQITGTLYPISSIIISIIFSLVFSRLVFDSALIEFDKNTAKQSIAICNQIYEMRTLNENYSGGDFNKLFSDNVSSAYSKVIGDTTFVSLHMDENVVDSSKTKYYSSLTYKGKPCQIISSIIDKYLKIKDIVNKIKKMKIDKRLIITGYRNGGSLSELLAIDLMDQSIIDPSKLHCITFGTPAIGDRAYTDYKNSVLKNEYSIIAGEDPYVYSNDHLLDHDVDTINLGYRTGIFDTVVVGKYTGKIRNYVNAIDRNIESYEDDCMKRYVFEVALFVIIYALNIRFISSKCYPEL